MGKHRNKKRAQLERRVRENSKDPEAWYKLGRYHDDRGELSQAESCYRRALLVSNNTYAEAMASIGAIRLEQKKYREAERLVRKALDIEPNNAAIITLLSMVLCQVEEYDEAIDLATRATEIEPDNSHTWHQLSMAYYISGDMDEAERAARRCLSEDPTDSDHWITLGMVLHNSGKLAEAEEAYKTSVRLDPFMPLGSQVPRAALPVRGKRRRSQAGMDARPRGVCEGSESGRTKATG